MSCCGVTIEAHRNADLRITYVPSRLYSFAGFTALMQVRDGATVLKTFNMSATANGSVFSIVGDSLVLTIKKADLLALALDVEARVLSYDIVITQGGFEDWFLGGDFVLLGLNEACADSDQNVTVEIGGQSVDVTVSGGNIGVGASVLLADLNAAVESAAESAEEASVNGAAAGATAGAAAGATSGASAGTTAGATAGTAAAEAVVSGKVNVAGDNTGDTFRQNAFLYLNPKDYNAVGGGVVDDTAAWLAALATGRTLGLPVDGLGLTYGVASFSFAPNVEIRNATFKHLAPDSGIEGSVASKVVECIGTGMNAGEWLRLSGVKVLRNGGSVSTTLYPNQGIRVVNVTDAYIDADVSGNNAGELFKIDTVKRAYLNVTAHDAGYVHSTQTNDTIEGVVLSNVESVFGNVSIDRLGRTDMTSAQRWRYSRGLTLDRVGGGQLNVKITRCEQPVDASGLGSSSNLKLAGYIGYCFTSGIKLAHSHHIDNISNFNIEHVGRYGVLIGGPGDSESIPYQQNIRVSGLSISEIGSSGYYTGVGSPTAGVVLDRNSGNAVLASFPKNVVVEGNVITSYTGSVVVTRNGNELLMADGSFPVSTCKPVIFSTTDALPNPIVAGTTYWLIWDKESLNVQIATSYNNAEDGVFVTLTNAGSGVHTMTGKSFMDYRGWATTGSVKDRASPNYFRWNQGNGATVSDNSGFAGRSAYIATDAGVSCADSTWTDVVFNGVGKVDPDNIYNTSTGVFTLTQGVWTIAALVAFVSNATGIRDLRIMTDTGSGYAQAFPFVRANSSGASDPTEVATQETLIVPYGGLTMKVQARQSSGGGSLMTHVNSRASVVLVAS